MCTSLGFAECLNPSEVQGLSLESKGFKDFLKDILKDKNIKVLNLSALGWIDMYEYLSPSQKRKFDKAKKTLGACNILWKFMPNTILTIPDELASLTKLELVYLMDTNITIEALRKIEKLLPNAIVVPSSKELEDEINFLKDLIK